MALDLQILLSRAYAKAHAAWPNVEVSASDFAEFLASGIDPGAAELDQLHVEDLYLAFACARHDPCALEQFESHFLSQVPVFLRSFAADRSLAEEVTLALRTKLFVAARGARPKILEYSGRGKLTSWLRVVTVRAAVELLRSQKELPTSEYAASTLVAPGDPEVDAMLAQHRAAFEAALREAMSALSARERALLRMHYGESLSVESIAAMYKVHRTTANRWLMVGRQKVLDTTRALLRERVAMTASQFDSLSRVLRSRLEVSLGAMGLSGGDRE